MLAKEVLVGKTCFYISIQKSISQNRRDDMLFMEADGYRFPMVLQQYDFEPDLVDIWIGNPNCKPKPCLNISVFKGKEAVINDLAFYRTCSV